jgi:CheY-like chemotaxis protein
MIPIDRRVLIADDDRELRAGVADLLAGLGLEILEAESGSEALRIVRVTSLQLALLDQHMPGPSGLEILSTIRRETLGVPCFFLSGDATEAILEAALREGALAVFRKPVEPARLRQQVIEALRISPGTRH